MSYSTFQEYLTHKNKIAKPKVEKVPDYTGPSNKLPPKENKHKDAGGCGQKGNIKPYKGGTNAKNPNKAEKGFADEGDKDLKYIPKTQEWVEQTKNMSLPSFTKMLREKTLSEDKNPMQSYTAIKTLTEMCQNDKNIISKLIREMKRSNLLETLVLEALNHPESIKLIKENKMFKKPLGPSMDDMATPNDDSEMHHDMDSEDDSEMHHDMDSENDSEEDEDMDSEDMDSEDSSDSDSLGEPEGGKDLSMDSGNLPMHKHHHAHAALKKMKKPMMGDSMTENQFLDKMNSKIPANIKKKSE